MTLLELMVVVAMVGVLAALALPSLRGSILHTRARSGSEAVRAALLRARNTARLQHTCVALRMQNGVYAIEVVEELYPSCNARALLDLAADGTYANTATLLLADELGPLAETRTRLLQDTEGSRLVRLAASTVILFGPLGTLFVQAPEDVDVLQTSTGVRLARYRVWPGTGLVREAP